MRFTLPLCLALIATAVVSSFAQDGSISKDESTIRAVVAKYVEARERIDPDATAALFTDDADQLVSSGEWRKGRDEVVRGTTASSRNTAGRRSITLTSVRFLTPEVAVADGRYEIGNAEGAADVRRMWTTLVLKKGADGWRIAAIRNMAPTEQPTTNR